MLLAPGCPQTMPAPVRVAETVLVPGRPWTPVVNKNTEIDVKIIKIDVRSISYKI